MDISKCSNRITNITDITNKNYQSTLHCQVSHFQSVLHADANTLADAGPLKAKYPVNAENFKRDLWSDPFKIKNFLSAVQSLK